jgi:hypothetical protein
MKKDIEKACRDMNSALNLGMQKAKTFIDKYCR